MIKLLSLSNFILGNLSIPKKMLLLGVLLIAPLLIQTELFIERTNDDIHVVRMEQKGIEYSAQLRKLLQLLPLYRDVAYVQAKQIQVFEGSKKQLLEDIEKAIESVDQVDWRLGGELKMSEHWARIKSRWQVLSSDNTSSADKQFEQYTRLIEDLLGTMVLVADNSGLVLDPNIETYYLMMMLVYETPSMINAAQTLRALSGGRGDGVNVFGEGALHIPTLVGVLRNQQVQLIKAQSKVLQKNPHLREKMGFQLEKTLFHLAEFSAEMLVHTGQKPSAEQFSLATKAVDSLFDVYDLGTVELDVLLEQQIAKFVTVRNHAVISICVCLLIGVYLFAGFYVSLARDLIELVKASKRIADGQVGHRVLVHGQDELSTVAIGFNDMAEALEDSQFEVNNAYHKLELLTKSDPLTGLPNRRFLDEVLVQEWQRAIRNSSSLSVLMLDVDHFKQFNDLYGHAAGDDCLCKVAKELGVLMKRGGDFVARYGGEEFIVISPETNANQAAELALAIQKGIEGLFIPHGDSEASEYVTISLGVASMKPKKAAGTSKNLIEKADQALYKAKDAGRNCYVVDESSIGPKSVKAIYPNKDKKA